MHAITQPALKVSLYMHVCKYNKSDDPVSPNLRGCLSKTAGLNTQRTAIIWNNKAQVKKTPKKTIKHSIRKLHSFSIFYVANSYLYPARLWEHLAPVHQGSDIIKVSEGFREGVDLWLMSHSQFIQFFLWRSRLFKVKCIYSIQSCYFQLKMSVTIHTQLHHLACLINKMTKSSYPIADIKVFCNIFKNTVK